MAARRFSRSASIQLTASSRPRNCGACNGRATLIVGTLAGPLGMRGSAASAVCR